MPLLRSVTAILLDIQVSAMRIHYYDQFAPAHIIVSSPALPSLCDIVWMYLQNVMAIDHQSFGIVIRERLVLVLSSI